MSKTPSEIKNISKRDKSSKFIEENLCLSECKSHTILCNRHFVC